MSTERPKRSVADGFADEGYGQVVDAFRSNFADGLEAGAALSVCRDGRLVVDLYGGQSNSPSGDAWSPDTLAVGYSVSKGVLALLAHLARQRGLLEFDSEVTTLWPEYGANGKQETTIRDLLSHRAGLPALDTALTLDDLEAWTPVVRAVEQQAPMWPPGTDFVYHPVTFGWLVGELLRRATGMLPGQLLHAWIAEPLGARAWFGLPLEYEPHVARHGPSPAGPDPRQDQLARLAQRRPEVLRAFDLGGALPISRVDGTTNDFNSRRLHALGIPSSGCIADASSLARIYACAVSSVDGHEPLLTAASIDDATAVRSSGRGRLGPLGDPGARFSSGFMTHSEPSQPMLTDRSFGHNGASGSLAFADAALGIGFAYVNNRFGPPVDPRARRLTAALRRCVT